VVDDRAAHACHGHSEDGHERHAGEQEHRALAAVVSM
jgi:hypothetical protein